MPEIQFATQSYRHRSLPLSAQRCVNAYAEKEVDGSKSPIAVLVAPGLTLFAQVGTGPIRGMRVMNGLLYVVSGQLLYSVSTLGVATLLGGNISGTAPVSMSDNGTQLCIVNGTNGYIYSATLGFVLISDANFHSAYTVTFFDNYFVFDWTGTNKYFISNSLDGTTYSGTDFASAEVSPDNVVAVINQQENLLIFNQKSIETWYDAGSVNFPFLRVDGATIERGCAASLSVLKEDNAVFFLGDDGIFYRLNGIQPVRISTHAIEDAWAGYATISDCVAFSYTYEGHKFIVVTFPTANATWVHDLSTGLWHERESWDQNNNSYTRWRGNCVAATYGRVLIGDAYSGRVGYVDATTFTEFDNVLRAVMVAPPLHNDRKRVFVSSFELDMDSGEGLTSGQGSDPQVMLDYSVDGGRTFSGIQSWTSLGAIGAYRQRIRWTRLGSGRQWTPRITISDPVKRIIISAHADVSSGM